MLRKLFASASITLALVLVPSAIAGAVEGSGVIAVGAAPDAGSLLSLGINPNKPVLGISSNANGTGYWFIASDGGVFAFPTTPPTVTPFYGSMGGQRLNQPMVGMAPTPDGGGYWLFAGDGGIFSFGNAQFYGSTGAMHLNAPVVGMTPTASGKGYWMVAADGGVFAYGDATFLGSTGNQVIDSPIVGMATMKTGNGYWIVTSTGKVYAFGAARADIGDLAGKKLSNDVVGMAATNSGNGYWLAQQDGQVWAFGDASTALAGKARCLAQPVVGIAARPQGDGVWLATAPMPAPVTKGLPPLEALDQENIDLELGIGFQQGCQSPVAASSIAWVDPLPGSHVSSAFGQRINPVYHLPQFHRGIDLAGGDGKIRAAAAGTVVQTEGRLGYGNATVIDHGGQISTVYAHQASFSVKVGDHVTAGQVIGVVGHTGFATGPHLHFEIRVDGKVIDPTALLAGSH